jgi:TonB family protein
MLVAVAVILAPALEPFDDPPVLPVKRNVVKIEAPLYYEPTQKAPNVGKITRQLDASNSEGSPAPRRYRPPAPSSGTPLSNAAPIEIEPLRLDNGGAQGGQAAVPGLGTGIGGGIRAAPGPSPTVATVPGGKNDVQITAAPPEPPGARSKPAENPTGPQTARLNPPDTKRGSPPPPGGVTVGDIELPAALGTNQLPSQCANEQCSALQLLSDAQNVDFRPYLQQVLAVVKRNWLTVIPDAAKAGRRGVVVIKFFIQRNGAVSTLSISATSGNGSMDRAAVAGMSMSNPFPPLPAGYKGDEIHLQMAFAYNPAH